MSATTSIGRGRPRLKNLHLTLRYEDDLKAFRSRWSRAGILALVVLAFTAIQWMLQRRWVHY